MRTRIRLALLGWLAISLPGVAQDEAESSAESAAETPPETSAETPPEGSLAEALAEMEAAEEDTDAAVDEDFIFSEEIPADTQLIFPVDI